MDFKNNLRTIREKNDLTAKQLVDMLGISYSTYMNYENRGKEPKYEMLRKIASALGCTPNDLLGFSPSTDEAFLYYADMVESITYGGYTKVHALPDGTVAIKSDASELNCTFPNKETFIRCFRNAETNMKKYSVKYKIALNETIVEILENCHHAEQANANTISHAVNYLQNALSKATTPEERGKLKQALKKALSELESSE